MMDYKCWRCQKNYVNQLEGWNYCPECGAPIQDRHKTQHPHFISGLTLSSSFQNLPAVTGIEDGLLNPTGVSEP